MLVDEAHLVCEETGPFHQPYKDIGLAKARIPKSAVWCAVTGTITPSNTHLAAKQLGFTKGSFINARYSLNRPNITFFPRFYQHAVSGSEFYDLSFLIPYPMTSHLEICLCPDYCNIPFNYGLP